MLLDAALSCFYGEAYRSFYGITRGFLRLLRETKGGPIWCPCLLLIGSTPRYTEELKASQPDRDALPSSLQPKPDLSNLPKIVIKFFLHQSGVVAAKFDYNAVC